MFALGWQHTLDAMESRPGDIEAMPVVRVRDLCRTSPRLPMAQEQFDTRTNPRQGFRQTSIADAQITGTARMVKNGAQMGLDRSEPKPAGAVSWATPAPVRKSARAGTALSPRLCDAHRAGATQPRAAAKGTSSARPTRNPRGAGRREDGAEARSETAAPSSRVPLAPCASARGREMSEPKLVLGGGVKRFAQSLRWQRPA
jgi:hypothetical protein